MSLPLAVLFLSVASHAFQAVTFESELGAARQIILADQAGLKQAQNESLAKEIEALALEADRLRDKASSLSGNLDRIRRRLQRERESLFLRIELDRLVAEFKVFRGDAAKAGKAADRICKSARKDPALLAPARKMRDNAKRFSSAAMWLEIYGRDASVEFRRAGYDFQAWDIERSTSDAMWAARDWLRLSKKLLNKVK